MKKIVKIFSILVAMLLVIPFSVNAEEEQVILTCDKDVFKVGTDMACKATIKGIDKEALLRVELGEGLTMKIASTNDNYSIELVEGATYLLTKGASVTEPANLDITLSLASNANIDKTGIELKLYKEFNKILYGDVNGDGNVTAADTALIVRHIEKQDELTAEQKKVADIDKDGEVTSLDLAKIKEIVDGISEKIYGYEIPSTAIGISSGPVMFDVDCTSDEKVDVPDTASNLSIWLYVGGAICIAFGIFLIVESRRGNKK